MEYFLKYILPAVVMFGMALFAGSHKNATIGLFGFLAFFLLGVVLLVEGKKRLRENAKK